MESILESMETIDDDCDVHGVHFVKISDPAAAYHYGVSSLPTLVYFKNKMPNIFEGDERQYNNWSAQCEGETPDNPAIWSGLTDLHHLLRFANIFILSPSHHSCPISNVQSVVQVQSVLK